MLTILPSSSTRAILLTSLAIYYCFPLTAIQYYIKISQSVKLNNKRHVSSLQVLCLDTYKDICI